MTIIVFLVDTSASMNQRAYVAGRKTLLDISKEAVEVFVKQRQKSAESRGDRYMLLTFDEFPRNIKAGWKENLATFMTELKNLEASGMTTMGSALKAVFDTLNINRMQSGIDMYGQGRYPYFLEPAVIVVVTDGGKLTTLNMVQRELTLPMNAGAVGGMAGVPGAEMTREPFRWDQRLYALVLRMAGHPSMAGAQGVDSGHVACDHSPIDAMCEVTGGRSYAVTSQRVLHQCIESLVQKLQSGVVIHFEKIGSDPPLVPELETPLPGEGEQQGAKGLSLELLEGRGVVGSTPGPPSRPHTPNPLGGAGGAVTNTAWHSCRKLIYVQRSAQKGFAVGFWPLPESFWPDVAAHSLPTRSAHPTLKFTCSNQEPMIIDNLPFDKYELEPSPLTLFILGRKQPNFCWQVFIQGSAKNGDIGHPFGYLKASTNLLTVNLFVLPYNYPQLLPLLDELFKTHRLKPSNEWRTQFHNYIRTMPAYYAGPLRRALARMGAGNLAGSLIPEALDNSLSYTVLNYLKRLKNQAKSEYDRIVSLTPFKGKVGPEGIKVTTRGSLRARQAFESLSQVLREQLTDFPGYMLGVPGKQGAESHPLRNPFDIPRGGLLDQLVRMRANLVGRRRGGGGAHTLDSDTRHSLPIGQMGNYQEYLKKMPQPLRELESQPVRQHMFGNPFKINKNLMMTDEVSGIVDEVQLVSPSGIGPQSGAPRGVKRPLEHPALQPGPPKRRKGALPKDFRYVSPSCTPPPSPSPPLSPSPVPPSSPVPTLPPALLHNSAPAPLLTNGIGLPGIGTVYRGGKMASFRALCEAEAESDGEGGASLPLPLAITPALEKSVSIEESFETEPVTEKIKNLLKCKPVPVLASSESEMGPGPPVFDSQEVMEVIGSETEQQEQLNFTKLCQSDNYSSHHPVGGSPAVLNGENHASDGVETEGVVVGLGRVPKSEPPGSTPPSPSNCPPLEPQSEEFSEEELRSMRLRNNNVRQLIYKEVKRPGRRHTVLWDMLGKLQGPPFLRRQFILEVKQEAVRFKRKDLAEELQARSDMLVKLEESSKPLAPSCASVLR